MRNFLRWQRGTFDLVPFYTHATLCRAAYYRDVDVLSRAVGAWDIDRVAHIETDVELLPFTALFATPIGVVIAFEGTTELQQWFWHTAGAVSSFQEGFPGKVHSAWAVTARVVYERVRPTLEEFRGRPIYLCGHSYGGAVAALFAYLVQNDFPGLVAGVFTIGQPRIGDQAAAAAVTWPVVRLRNTDDPFPSVPPERAFRWLTVPEQMAWNGFLQFTHQGEEWTINDAAEVVLSAGGRVNWRDPQAWTLERQPTGQIFFADHFANHYCYRIRRRLAAATVLDFDQSAQMHFCDRAQSIMNFRDVERWPYFPSSPTGDI